MENSEEPFIYSYWWRTWWRCIKMESGSLSVWGSDIWDTDEPQVSQVKPFRKVKHRLSRDRDVIEIPLSSKWVNSNFVFFFFFFSTKAWLEKAIACGKAAQPKTHQRIMLVWGRDMYVSREHLIGRTWRFASVRIVGFKWLLAFFTEL